MTTTPHLGIPELAANQDDIDVTTNEGFRYAEGVIQGNVIDKDLTAPPGSPADGDRYIVGAASTGAWSGEDGNIAVYKSTSWVFLTPVEGWLVYAQDENKFYVHSGSAWAILTGDQFNAPVDVYGFLAGVPGTAAVLTRVPLSRASTFPDDFAGSVGKASAASSGTITFNIKKNGSTVGTMVFATSATATFLTSGGATTFAAGDVIEVIESGGSPSTLANVGFVLKGYVT